MSKADRHERLETIKALGRLAYRHLRDAEIAGNITVGGEEKRWRVLEEGGLSAELLEPVRPTGLPTEQSQIQIRYFGRKVLDIRWDGAGGFKAVHFEPGEWERLLIDLPNPIPM